ncbi:uncharacterized protein LOC142320562 isoform X1 [Lycorma delicatula]|uniref:uncharacterized protein LOC142320562 isoform X1 n=1 Tax=Lycorma delicatula TaxID=130591 RepID=UPI003F50FE87
MKPVFEKGERGKRLLILDDGKFTFRKVLKNNETFWRCPIKTCKAKVWTAGPEKIVSRSELQHNHPKNNRLLNRQKVSSIAKKKEIEDLMEKPSNIIGAVLKENITITDTLTTKDVNYLRNNIYHERKKNQPPLLKRADETIGSSVCTSMDWSNEKSLRLIDLYEQSPIIWDPSHGSYYNKTMKKDAWIKISEELGCSYSEARRKMESLLGSFRREKTRAKRIASTNKGRIKPYRSRWFAFKRLEFLLNKKTHRSNESRRRISPEGIIINEVDCDVGNDIDLGEVKDISVKTEEFSANSENVISIPESHISYEVLTDAQENNNNNNNNEGLPNEVPVNFIVKEDSTPSLHGCTAPRESIENEPPWLEEAFKTLREAINVSQSANNCDVFAQHVANKLKKYSEKVRCIVEHKITSVLFQADMCQFDSPSSFQSSSVSDTFTIPPATNIHIV